MIEFKHIKKQAGRIGLVVRGHARYAPPGADDIVCAAVSAACQTAIIGCHQQVKDETDINVIAERPGHFVFTVKDMPTTRALIDATYEYLRHVKDEYPGCFK